MSFRNLGGAFIFCLWCFAPVARADDAQDLLHAARRVYVDAVSYSAVVDSRTIPLYPPNADAAEGKGTPVFYRRLVFRTVLASRDYYVASISFYEGNPAGGSDSDGSTRSAALAGWQYLACFGNTTPKQGGGFNGQYAVKEVTPRDQFGSLLNWRIGGRMGPDLVLRQFVPENRNGSAGGPMGGFPSRTMSGLGASLSELTEPKLVENEQDGMVAHIETKSRTGAVHLWIDRNSYLIIRSIVRSPVGMAPGGSAMVETLYKNQRIDPKLMPGDFRVPERPDAALASARDLEFGEAAEALKIAGAGAPLEGQRGGGTAQAPAATAQPAAPETQALTTEQMAGIVLIDGDVGSGTGFMTKIKDVDFIVTNLHVLSGNKKLTIKTLRGEEIQPQAVFGAVGSDIAILRIASGRGDLRISTDVFSTTKIGDRVVVVGNRRGGGVATQTSGAIKGVGPSLVEVDANFQPGNSGSPIVNLSTGEVVGIASYSESRRVEVDNPGAASAGRSSNMPPTTIEKRWFGFRLDSVSKWEAVDLARFAEQSERLENFRELSEALVAVLKIDFDTARRHPRLSALISNFERKVRTTGSNELAAANEVRDLFRVIHTVADDGVKDLTNGNYYDFFRSCQYWENSIPAQLDYRKRITDALQRYESNSSAYLSRLRNGG